MQDQSAIRLQNPREKIMKCLKQYVRINYGPYDVIYGNERFIPGEPKVRPLGAGFYPIDMTKDEFEKQLLKIRL